jgi:hypothetical protein
MHDRTAEAFDEFFRHSHGAVVGLALADEIMACLPPGTDEHDGDPVVRAFPQSVTPPTVALTPTT